MSDGCLSKSGRNKNRYTVRICSNDFDIIEWLHTYMCVGNKIYKQGQNGFVIQFRNECSIKFMMDYGLKERKSLDAVFPDIPDDFLGDFIRGYFDGNGSMVLQRTRYNTYAQVSFTSGSKKVSGCAKRQTVATRYCEPYLQRRKIDQRLLLFANYQEKRNRKILFACISRKRKRSNVAKKIQEIPGILRLQA